MCKRFIPAILLIMLLVLPGAVLASPVYVGNSPLLPPPDGVYLSPQNVHAEYDGPGLQVILQDIKHGGFANIIRTPDGGGNTTETFDSTVTGNVSVNSGPNIPVFLTGPVSVELFGYSPNDTGTFATEMLSLDLSGGGVLIRESPTLSSNGQTTITDMGGGQFQIVSFFDVFTELSLDGGNTWMPSQGSTHVDLTNTPLPATWVMFLSGLGLLGFIRRRKKQIAA